MDCAGSIESLQFFLARCAGNTVKFNCIAVGVKIFVDCYAVDLAAVLLDISAGGVGLRLNQPLAPGKEFTLTLPGGAEVGKPLRYRVARRKPLGQGKFLIGAQFVGGKHAPSKN
jgi:hypothetical protein